MPATPAMPASAAMPTPTMTAGRQYRNANYGAEQNQDQRCCRSRLPHGHFLRTENPAIHLVILRLPSPGAQVETCNSSFRRTNTGCAPQNLIKRMCLPKNTRHGAHPAPTEHARALAYRIPVWSIYSSAGLASPRTFRFASLWTMDLFRCESILLRSHWVMVVMDVFTRLIVGFGVESANSGPNIFSRLNRELKIASRFPHSGNRKRKVLR